VASIELDQVTIEFPIYNARGRSLTVELFRRTVGGLIQSDTSSNVSVVALRDISLVLTDGDRLGLIGHNGAGKTTLLRVLAGIYEPLFGRARINGTVASLTDITMGMDFEATGYENIVQRGVFLGLQAKEMRRMIPEIEAFTELGEFLSLPLRTYSSGMLLRLAFAVTTAVVPEILIMDELIGAGDAAFIVKATARLNQMISSSNILVISSHDVETIRRLCNKAALMQSGRLIRIGPVDEVISAYLGGDLQTPNAPPLPSEDVTQDLDDVPGSVVKLSEPQPEGVDELRGFSLPEASGRWTDGKEASIGLALESPATSALKLTARVAAFVIPQHSKQAVDILVNGNQIGRWEFHFGEQIAERQIVIPHPVANGARKLLITFLLPDAVVPADLKFNSDARMLGISVAQIRVSASTE